MTMNIKIEYQNHTFNFPLIGRCSFQLNHTEERLILSDIENFPIVKLLAVIVNECICGIKQIMFYINWLIGHQKVPLTLFCGDLNKTPKNIQFIFMYTQRIFCALRFHSRVKTSPNCMSA